MTTRPMRSETASIIISAQFVKEFEAMIEAGEMLEYAEYVEIIMVRPLLM